MSEAKWYVVHTYSGYENKVKANIDKTVENRHLEDQILEVRVPMQDVVETEERSAEGMLRRRCFRAMYLIHMIMNDDTWYVVRNTRGVTGFVGPGSKPVPLTDAEMAPLGIQHGQHRSRLRRSVTPYRLLPVRGQIQSALIQSMNRAEAESDDQC